MDEIVKSRAIVESQSSLLENYAVITGKVAIAQQTLDSALDQLATIDKTMASQKGANEAIKREIASLEKFRQTLTAEIGDKQSDLDASSARLVDLKQQTQVQITVKQSTDNELELIKGRLESEQAKLLSITAKANEAQKKLSTFEHEIANAKNIYADTLRQTREQSAKLKSDTDEIAKVAQNITLFKKEIDGLTQQKTTLDAQIMTSEAAKEDATATLITLDTQIKAKRQDMAKLEEENAKMLATKGTLTAQVSALQELVTTKKQERYGLDAKLKELLEVLAAQNKQIALLENSIKTLTAERHKLQTDMALLKAQNQETTKGVD